MSGKSEGTSTKIGSAGKILTGRVKMVSVWFPSHRCWFTYLIYCP